MYTMGYFSQTQCSSSSSSSSNEKVDCLTVTSSSVAGQFVALVTQTLERPPRVATGVLTHARPQTLVHV